MGRHWEKFEYRDALEVNCSDPDPGQLLSASTAEAKLAPERAQGAYDPPSTPPLTILLLLLCSLHPQTPAELQVVYPLGQSPEVRQATHPPLALQYGVVPPQTAQLLPQVPALHTH
jgi:hypothetical protein